MDRREAIRRTTALMGGVISAPALTAVLSGCRAKPTLDWTPDFFTAPQGRLIEAIAETIIPRTETGGARDAGVPGFIDLMLKEAYPEEVQERFLKQLDDFDAEARRKYGSSFVELSKTEQEQYVIALQDAAMSDLHPERVRPFILIVRELTLLGFFTSEVGATEVLQYQAVPGAYHGCLELKEVGKTWAT